MHHTIRRSISIVITESWRVVWEDADAPPPEPEAGSHVIVWDENQPAPELIVLRRKVDGSGWRVESGETNATASG